MGSYTYDDLREFWKNAGEKGWAKPATASARRQACKLVLEDLEPEHLVDVRQVDVARAIRQFHNRNPSVAPASLAAYQSRVRKAIEEFVEWRDNPVTWKPSGERLRAPAATSRTRSPSNNASDSSAGNAAQQPESQAATREQPGLSYAFPLRPDHMVTLANLPRDLKISECERLAAFLRTLAQDFEPR